MSAQFDAFVTQYHNLVMSLIFRYYGGRFRDQAEDLSQEIWSKLWESFKKNENNIVNFKSYLYRTVQTTLWDASHSLDKALPVDVFADDEEISGESNEDRVHSQMAMEHLLERLPSEHSRMMRAHLKGFTHQEISVLMGCSEGRVRNLLSRIKKKMAAMGGR